MTQRGEKVRGACGHMTNSHYMRNTNGLCKRCYINENAARCARISEERQGRLIDHGHDACQREDGAYDLPDWA